MPYSAEISRANPTCFLFLIDQSKSMRDPMAGAPGKSKAQAVAEAINQLIYTLVLRCISGSNVLDRCYLGVIGYGASVGPAFARGVLAGRDLLPVSLVACNQSRLESRTQTGPDGSAYSTSYPIWFEPQAEGNTPMCAALNRAGNVLAGFLADHPNCFPPVVINITDGMANDGDPRVPAAALCRLSSNDGNVLLFNAQLSKQPGQPIEFPASESGLPSNFARLLFRMSSPLPPSMWGLAHEKGMLAGVNTRCFVFNADLDSVIRCLDIGTRTDRTRRAPG